MFPRDSVVAAVERLIFDAISRETDVDEDPARVKKWVRARQEIVELGNEADMALAAIIVKSLKLKREFAIDHEKRLENVPRTWVKEQPPSAGLEYLIRLARNDPTLRPLLFQPIADWWDEFVAGASYSFSLTETEAAFYLYKWGDDAMRKRLLEQAESLTKATHPNIFMLGERLKKELPEPYNESLGVNPKGPFHEWCIEQLERDKKRAASIRASSMDLPGRQSPESAPQRPTQQRDTSVPTSEKPQPGHKGTTAWVIGLVVVLVGVGWVYRITRRKAT
jgi:hypothetical protein